MVLECPNCGGSVGEDSCTGCREVVPAYLCSHCKQTFWNPRFKSEVTCPSCGEMVVEHPQRSLRHITKYYLCHRCGAVVDNPKYTHDSYCKNCNRRCPECKGYVACDQHNEVCRCVDCGKEIIEEE